MKDSMKEGVGRVWPKRALDPTCPQNHQLAPSICGQARPSNPTFVSPQPKREEECKITNTLQCHGIVSMVIGKGLEILQQLSEEYVFGQETCRKSRAETNPRDNLQTTSQPAARHRAGACMVTNPSAHRTVTRVAPHQHPCLRTAPQRSLASHLLQCSPWTSMPSTRPFSCLVHHAGEEPQTGEVTG
jgi:hypothetical protein